jgi:hypothetical protein
MRPGSGSQSLSAMITRIRCGTISRTEFPTHTQWKSTQIQAAKSCPIPGPGTSASPPVTFLHSTSLFVSRHNAPLTYRRYWEVELIKNLPGRSELWLAQANHIFTQLQETAHSEDYGTSLPSSILQYSMTHEPSLRNRNIFRSATFAQCLQH